MLRLSRLLAGVGLFVCCALRLGAAPVLTTIQDTLYMADGTLLNGVVIITWPSFVAADGSEIAAQTLTVAVPSGYFQVALAPTVGASTAVTYSVRINSAGKNQSTELWSVPQSSTPLSIHDVMIVQTGGIVIGSGGTVTVNDTTIPITDVVGLSNQLTMRPMMGPAFADSRAAIINSTGGIDAAAGNPSDCVHVDGTSGSCGGSSSASSFADAELPKGTIDGSNTQFALSATPAPASSVAIWRNGLFLNSGVDYTVSGNVITFAAGSTPLAGDTILASYRTGTVAGDGASAANVNCTSASGSGTAYTCPTALATTCTAGMTINWTPDVTNGTSPNVNVGCGAKNLRTNENASPTAGLFAAGVQVPLWYDGTEWRAPASVPTPTGSQATGNVAIGATVLVDAHEYSSLSAACAAAATNNATLLISTSWTLSANVTCTAPMFFYLATGALIKPNGYALAMPYPSAPVTQRIFDVSAGGSVSFSGLSGPVPVTWFGAQGTASQDGACSIAAGQYTLTCSSGFTTAEAGDSIAVQGAGTAGGTLLSTIQSVSSGVATLANAAGTTTTGQTWQVAIYGSDDSAAFAAAVATGLPVQVPLGYYYIGQTNAISFSNTRNGRLTCEGANNSLADFAGVRIVYAPPTGSLIQANSARSLKIEDCGLRYLNLSYNGNLVDLSGTSSANTTGVVVSGGSIGGMSSVTQGYAVPGPANSLIYMDYTNQSVIEDIIWWNARQAILTSNASYIHANGNTIGPANYFFGGFAGNPIQITGEAWTVVGNQSEPYDNGLNTGQHCGLLSVLSGNAGNIMLDGLNLKGNLTEDATMGNGVCVDLSGAAVDAVDAGGNDFGYGGTGIKMGVVGGGVLSSGIHIHGNNFRNLTNAVDTGTNIEGESQVEIAGNSYPNTTNRLVGNGLTAPYTVDVNGNVTSTNFLPITVADWTAIPTNDTVCAVPADPTFFGTGVLGTATITGAMSNYVNGDTWTASGNNSGGANASGTINASGGAITSLTFTNGGTKFTANPTTFSTGSGGSGAVVAFSSCGNTSDPTTSIVTFPGSYGTTSTYTIPAYYMVQGRGLTFSYKLREWSPATAQNRSLRLTTSGGSSISAWNNYSQSASASMVGMTEALGFSMYALDAAGTTMGSPDTTIMSGVTSTLMEGTTGEPVHLGTSAHTAVAAIQYSPTSDGGLRSLNYVSGATVTGGVGQTCTLNTFNNGLGSTPTVTATLTAANTLTGATFAISNAGYGGTAAPTTANVASGTATCSGAGVNIAGSTLGGAAGAAIQIVVATVHQTN
ncbi:MAG: hypothetical protein ABSF98_17125 [Bryobacteraceae bacterium]